ncbi:hypothetical protein ACV3PA_06755 [Exiguobacterium acetylicum]|uniref:hypothetical protein n=1 Tax=Exiguobacterium TaxID=33986 RepID=UPI000680B8A6|nr:MULTISPECIES: hypothetical protein [Exiguobacterium]KNH36668.1 hypothetical protein ACS74_06425 [Exiguobacterium acetylicum]KOP29964.1 hypothetical protein ADM98_14080 [Exiguobacterium sp. BMC-KP]MCY1690336.1 hypothetical protein [Exiguobacterium sp. SL14]UKS55328.1 hypothetical protein K6T22_12370 [Exiguobacterium acetylicum]
MILNRSQIAREKVEQLKLGVTAFTETEEIAEKIRKSVAELQLNVIEDHTDRGVWFIPQDKTKTQ